MCICLNNFYPSNLVLNENSEIIPKFNANPTSCVTKYSFQEHVENRECHGLKRPCGAEDETIIIEKIVTETKGSLKTIVVSHHHLAISSVIKYIPRVKLLSLLVANPH